ncbi:MAG: glycosyltransferase family 4 protein [Ktedonobacterales bacterium]|nr:glycosyltransferase family 4 protein [Ktedonobacterales bacterium]
MRVAFNALFLEKPQTGTGRYTAHLLAALGRVDGINDYVVFSPSKPAHEPETPSTFAWQVAPVGPPRRGGKRIEKVIWEQRVFPLAAKQRDARVMHIPYFAPVFRAHGIPSVVTIHDVISLRLPEYRASARAHAYARLMRRAIHHATAVIAVSNHAKSDIVEFLGVPEERITVIYEAPPPHYHRVSDEARLRAVREKYDLGQRFVLNVGGLDVRKNIPALVGAFAAVYHELGDPDLQLFIAGDPDRLGSSPLYPDWRDLAPMFGIAGQVICREVAEDDLPALYSAAACFVFTSRYEGFGLTPLEAMACGAPVICSDRAALPEVVGRAGVLVDPDDTDALSEQIRHVLADRERWDDLSARGQAHVKRFNWDQAAAETSALYAEVTGSRRE